MIAQDPQAGAKVKKGTTVTLTVSTGPGNATVPSVVGETLNQAKSAIQIANLKVGRVEHQSSTTVQEGQVIGDQPAGRRDPSGEYAGDDHRLDRAAAGEGARRDQRDRRPGEGAAAGSAR